MIDIPPRTHLPAPKQDRWIVELQRELARRCFVVHWARRSGIDCPTDYIRAFTRGWGGAWVADPSKRWRSLPALRGRLYRRLVAERALMAWLLEQGPTFFGIEWQPCRELEAEAFFVGLLEPEPPADVEADEPRWSAAAATRCFQCQWAAQAGITLPETERQRRTTELRRKLGGDPVGLAARALGWDSAGVRRWLERRFLAEWLSEAGPAHFGIRWSAEQALLDELRLGR